MTIAQKGPEAFEAREDCLWCTAELIAIGNTEAAARAALGKSAEKHLCTQKRFRNVSEWMR